MTRSLRSLLIAGERRQAALVDDASEFPADEEIALAYGLLPALPREASGWTSLGPAPLLERPLRLSYVSERLPSVPLLAPFGRRPRAGFRELTTMDPRMSRLWGRFSVDVRVAIERDAKFFGKRVFDRPGSGYRVFIMEDGDRYAIRAMCIFNVQGEAGYVMELLHDRSVDGMRGASHVLGLALRAMSDEGAVVARACSLSHSGTMPIYLRHAFTRKAGATHFAVRSVDEELADIVAYPEHWYLSYLDLDGM